MTDVPEKAPGAKMRWPRGQRFTVTPEGCVARSALSDAIAAARTASGGRADQEAAMSGWASKHGVNASDGSCLDEFTECNRNLAELAESLLTCGVSRTEAQAAIDRLVTAGLLAPVAKPLPAPPPPYQEPYDR